VSVPFPEATTPASSRTEVFLRYLDFFRDRVTAKVEALPAAELRRSRLPSGWTPLELVKHLRHVERRWLEWGFEGRDVGDPWADSAGGRWFVAAGETPNRRRWSGSCSTCSRSTPGTWVTWTSSPSSPPAAQENKGIIPNGPGACSVSCSPPGRP
jgi:hypothetical protein